MTSDDPEQATTGLMYLAWDATDHFIKVVVYLDAAVWEERFDRGDEQDYQEYLEETRVPAILEEADEQAHNGLFLEGQAVLDEELQRVQGSRLGVCRAASN